VLNRHVGTMAFISAPGLPIGSENLQVVMSVVGQKATFGRSWFRSVQPPTSDIGRLPQHVRKVPTTDIANCYICA
jgi:hypothetical protein